jgi:nucleoside-diphosphate-sugar epimerase
MKIVVTGAKGNIGSVVADYARSQGAQVLGVDNVGRGSWRERYIAADLSDVGNCYDVLRGADAVINLAAIPDSGMFPNAQTFQTNIAITYNVFLAAAHLGVPRVVWASSIQVNHTVPAHRPVRYQYFPLDEAHPVDPQSEYALSKYLGEQIAEYFARDYGLTTVSLRFTDVVTVERWPSLPAAIPPDARYPIPHYVHIHDCARACYLAATASLPPGSHTVAFIAARDTHVDMPSRDLIQRYYPDAELRADIQGYQALISGKRAEEAFGFVPHYSCRS